MFLLTAFQDISYIPTSKPHFLEKSLPAPRSQWKLYYSAWNLGCWGVPLRNLINVQGNQIEGDKQTKNHIIFGICFKHIMDFHCFSWFTRKSERNLSISKWNLSKSNRILAKPHIKRKHRSNPSHIIFEKNIMKRIQRCKGILSIFRCVTCSSIEKSLFLVN